MRSLTTEKPTEPTAPRPRAASIWAAKKPAKVPAAAVPAVPAAQISVPAMSSNLRLARSPT